MKVTDYFTNSVLPRQPYLKPEWIEFVISQPLEEVFPENGRIRRWGYIVEAEKYLRVVIEADGETVHNAFFDRGYRPQETST